MKIFISKFALAIVVAAVIALALTGNLISSSPFVIAGQLLAIAINVWSRISFPAGQFSIFAEPREGAVLTRGPYRFIRHPMYAAALLFTWSSVLGHISYLTMTIAVVVTATIALRINVEEEFLRRKFSDYGEYARNTRRVVPFIV